MTYEQQQYENNMARLHQAITGYMQKHGITNPTTGFEMYLGESGEHAAQMRTTHELLDWAAKLTPQHLANIERIVTDYGEDRLWNEMSRTGLSRDAVEMAMNTAAQTGGYRGLVGRVSELLTERASMTRQADIESVAERLNPQANDPADVAALKGGPLAKFVADPQMQALTGALYAENGTAIPPGQTAAGMFVSLLRGQDGETGLSENPAAFLNASRIDRGQFVKDARGNIAWDKDKPFHEKKLTDEEGLAKLAEFGGSADAVRYMLDTFSEADLRSDFQVRNASRRSKQTEISKMVDAQWAADPERSAQNDRRIRSEKSRHNVLFNAYDRLDEETPERPAAKARPSTVTETAEREPAPVTRRRALEDAFDEIDSRDEESTGSDSGGLRGVLSRRYDELEEEAA